MTVSHCNNNSQLHLDTTSHPPLILTPLTFCLFIHLPPLFLLVHAPSVTSISPLRFSSPSRDTSGLNRKRPLPPLTNTYSLRAMGPPTKVSSSPTATLTGTTLSATFAATTNNGKRRPLGPPPKVAPQPNNDEFESSSVADTITSATDTARANEFRLVRGTGSVKRGPPYSGFSLDPLTSTVPLPLPLPRPRPTLPPLNNHNPRSNSQYTLNNDAADDDDEQKCSLDQRRPFGSLTVTSDDSPTPLRPLSFSPMAPNEPPLTMSAEQLVTRLKPLQSLFRDSLKKQSKLHKRERPNLSTANNGRDDDGVSDIGNGDGDDDGDDEKTHIRPSRSRSPKTTVRDNKIVRIPPPLLPSPHQWNQQMQPLPPLQLHGNTQVRSPTAVAGGSRLDTLHNDTINDRVRLKPPPRLPGLTRTQLSRRMSSNVSLPPISSPKTHISAASADKIENTTTTVISNTSVDANVTTDVDVANEGQSNVLSSFSSSTTTTPAVTNANSSKVSFNLREISSGMVEAQDVLETKPHDSLITSTLPYHETTTPLPPVEDNGGHDHVPPPQILTPINRVKYTSWFDI